MLRQVSQVSPVFEFPGPRQGENKLVFLALDQAQIAFGGKAGIGEHDHLARPSRHLKATQHLTKLDVLLAFFDWVEKHGIDGNAESSPLGNQQEHRYAELEAVMLI